MFGRILRFITELTEPVRYRYGCFTELTGLSGTVWRIRRNPHPPGIPTRNTRTLGKGNRIVHISELSGTGMRDFQKNTQGIYPDIQKIVPS